MPRTDATASPDSPTRTEHDSFGPIEVPADRLWGAQTQRSLQHFAISTETMPPELIAALLQVKRAAARANQALAGLDAARADAIVAAADEVLAGRWPLEFPLSVWQTGSGTQTNMNVNEVLARRASALLGGDAGAASSPPDTGPQAATPHRTAAVHPNDDVNRSQSSNDVFPTAMHVAAVLALERRVLPALHALCATLTGLAARHRDLVKIGRTHLQDATPLTLGQEISGWAAQLAACGRALEQALPALRSLAIGGTAVGTGLNAPPGFGQAVCRGLTDDLGTPFTVADNTFAALAGHEAMALAHGVLRTLAAALTKVANDVRWLASGPRAGLGELRIPENEPGSSIMPGKVNPTQCEALTMAAMRVMGNDVVIGMAAAAGNFELNVYKPLIADAFLQSARLMADGIASFDRHCARGIEPVPDRMAELVARSLMLVTALSPHIGYDRAAKIARQAHAQGIGLREAAVASGWVAAADYDRWVDPAAMAGVGTAAA